MSIPVWPGRKPWLTPILGGATAIGQLSLGIFLLVTVTVAVVVDAAATVGEAGDWIRTGAIVEISGGTGEPDPASAGTGTGSVALAATSVGAKAGSLVPSLSGIGTSSRCPAVSVALASSPLTATMPV